MSPLAQADDLHNKKHHAHQAVVSAVGAMDESSKALTAATRQLTAAKALLSTAEHKLAVTQGELTAARVLDTQMQAKLAQAVQALAQAEQAVKDGEAAVVEQRADMGRLVASSYQYGDPSLLELSLLMQARTPEEVTTQQNTVDNMMDRETTAYDQLKATEALLKVQKGKVEQAKIAVAEQRRAAAANLVRRQALEREAAANRAEVATLVARRSQAAAAARKILARDAAKVRAARQEEKRIKKLILERAKHQKGGYHGGGGGFLLRPVENSYITSPFGWRKHPIYGYWGLHNGDDFHAPCGTPEHAGASGTVIAEYYDSVWGNRLFLDVGKFNGKAMTLIYNHISSYRVRSGAQVGRGDVVSYAGTTGWSTGCHLHFTVLLDGTPVDPVQFF